MSLATARTVVRGPTEWSRARCVLCLMMKGVIGPFFETWNVSSFVALLVWLRTFIDLPLPCHAGLYFKLHGTHRPNSMKKTVIKRRKRVPAAPGGPSSPTPQDRMTDQAAAEVLASVGRALPSGSAGAQTESEEEQPKKRARRPRTSRVRDKDAEGDVDEEDDEGKPRKARRTAGRATVRGGSHEGSSAQAGQWGETMMQGMGEPSGSYGPGAPRGNPFPHPHASQTLPGLIAALGPEVVTSLMNTQYGGVPPPPPSYVRSGSAQGNVSMGPGVPSRTHSPLAGHGMNALPGAPYGIPPPLHVPAHAPPPHFPGPVGHSFYHNASAPQHMEGMLPIPSMAELDHHYRQLAEERRRMEEMLERTDRIMAGVKRGLDEMRAAGGASSQEAQQSPQAQPQQQSPSQGQGQGQAQAQQSDGSPSVVPLNRQEKGSKEGASAPVWHVAPPASQSPARE